MLEISTDKKLLDADYVLAFLKTTYWAANRTSHQVQQSIENSLCFVVYLNNHQVEFAHKVFFSYLMNAFIASEYRGLVYGKQLITAVYNHGDLRNLGSHYLLTKDTQDCYAALRFNNYSDPNHLIKKMKV